MTYYAEQVSKITKDQFSNTYLIKQVICAKHFIEENYNKPITLNDICKEAGISKFHLIRSFRKIYGRTPNQFLASVRIQKAKNLLKKGHTVLDACYSAGFTSPTTFADLFKKKTGKSPRLFKRSAKKAILKR